MSFALDTVHPIRFAVGARNACHECKSQPCTMCFVSAEMSSRYRLVKKRKSKFFPRHHELMMNWYYVIKHHYRKKGRVHEKLDPKCKKGCFGKSQALFCINTDRHSGSMEGAATTVASALRRTMHVSLQEFSH
jgi:hypothetical protein